MIAVAAVLFVIGLWSGNEEIYGMSEDISDFYDEVFSEQEERNMMTLKDLINTMDDDTVVCVCDDCGALTDVAPLKNIGIKYLMNHLNRKVTRVYFDTSDNSITIELEDYNYEEAND